MQMQSKLNADDESTERAVSPVIGVILMVAITVILAAVIAAFVLDIGSTSSNPQAGFTINQISENETQVQINSIERLDALEISCGTDSAQQANFTDVEVGATEKIGEDGTPCHRNNVTIIGTYDGNEAVMN